MGTEKAGERSGRLNGKAGSELRLHMAEAVTCIRSALSNSATDKGRDGNPAILAAGAGVEPARDFSLNR
jgi:hypothetical protein